MAKSLASDVPHRAKGRILLLVFALLLLYVVVPRLGNFSDSFGALRNADPALVALACAGVVGTYILAAGIYTFLAFKPLRYPRTLLVQTANGFANRLLPAGLGGLTVYVQYLRKEGHALPQALAVAGTNNLVGMVGHALLLCAVLLADHEAVVGRISLPHIPNGWLVVAVLLCIVTANIIAFRRLRRYVYKLTTEILGYIAAYRKRPARLGSALLCSVCLTLCYVSVLYLCVHSLGLELSFFKVFVAFTLGNIVGTATPIPGGLVGAEAGLLAGLLAYGVDPAVALASVLLYRFLTYWLPLLPGFIVFMTIRRRFL